MKKTILIFMIGCLSLALFGCDVSTTPSTSSQTGSNAFSGGSGATTPDQIAETSPYGAPIESDPTKPYPIVKAIDDNLWIEVNYIDRNTGQIAKEKVKYFGIGRGFISNGKLAEARADCASNHFKKLSYSSCSSYPYKEIQLKNISSTYSDQFDPEAYVMEKNFRGESLNLSGKDGPYDIIFLGNKNQTTKLAKGGLIFDIFLVSSKRDDLDRPDPKRGTITMRNINGQTVTSGLSIRELLENCGQSGQEQPVIGYLGAIMLGPGADDQNRTSEEQRINQLNAQYNQMLNLPQEIYLSSLKSKRDNIVSLNAGKGSKIDAFLSSVYIDRPWTLVGQISSGQEHPGVLGLSDSEINLDKLIESLAGGTDKSTLFYDVSSGDNSLYLTVEINGTKFRYKPLGTAGAQIGASSAPETQALGIGAVQINQPPLQISTDPWCGFTPECKPAIYLYPTIPTKVNVEIGPSVGHRTITIPDYNPTTGWNVWAMPWGTLYSGGEKYSYLYYEAMTEYPAVPDKGWVLSGGNLEKELYDLGLKNMMNKTESQDFAKYWSAKLPKTNYIFAGLVSQDEIEKIEPLQISPAPKSLLRLRFYFVPLDSRIDVTAPKVARFVRYGFTAVEWGGYVEQSSTR